MLMTWGLGMAPGTMTASLTRLVDQPCNHLKPFNCPMLEEKSSDLENVIVVPSEESVAVASIGNHS